jgi:hypothetical protein
MDTPPEPPRGVEIYDRPPGADRPKWVLPVILLAVLAVLGLLFVLFGGLG